MRQYALYRTFLSALMTWGIPAFMLLLGPLFLFSVWTSWEKDRLAGTVFFAVWWIIVLGSWIWTLRIPRRIELHEDGRIVFHGPLRTLELYAHEISSIKPAGNSLGFHVLRHSRGKLQLLNQFDEFHDFLTRLKQSNPSVELRGC